jgi:hypothetical protein
MIPPFAAATYRVNLQHFLIFGGKYSYWIAFIWHYQGLIGENPPYLRDFVRYLFDDSYRGDDTSVYDYRKEFKAFIGKDKWEQWSGMHRQGIGEAEIRA